MNTRKVSLTLPIAVLEKVDSDRGDIKRSTYVSRLLERILKEKPR